MSIVDVVEGVRWWSMLARGRSDPEAIPRHGVLPRRRRHHLVQVGAVEFVVHHRAQTPRSCFVCYVAAILPGVLGGDVALVIAISGVAVTP